jgi:SSS family transporter
VPHVSTADWVVIVLYLIGVIAFGVWLGRGQKNARDYFLGSRNISWWGVSLSIVATETSALTFIGVPAIAYGGNLMFIQIIIGYVIARIVLAMVMVPHYFKGEIYSPYQLLEGAFGPEARRTASIFFLIAGTLAAGVRIYVTCIPLQLMFGFSTNQIIIVIILFVVLSLIYTYIGGVKAVIWTDVIQFVLLAGGGLFVLFYIPMKMGADFGPGWSAAVEEGKTEWFNGRFTLAAPYNIWMGVIGATFQVMSSHGVDQLNVQRVLTCRNVTEGRKALYLSAIIIFPLFLMFLIVGVMLWVFFQKNGFAIEVPELRPGVSKNDYVFPIFILTEIPTVLKGFLIVAILSAAMSSVSSALSALSSVSTMDLLKNWSRRQWTEEALLKFGRRSTIAWGVILIVVAWVCQQTPSALTLAFGLNGLTAGGLLGALVLVLWWKQGSPWPVVVGMVVSLLVMAWVSGLVNKLEPSLGDAPAIFWPWYTLIGTAITMVVAVVTKPVFNK